MVTPQEQGWRAEFPITRDLIYLNNCSLTPLPERGRRAIEKFTREWSELGGRAWYDHWIGEYEGRGLMASPFLLPTNAPQRHRGHREFLQ